MASTFETAYMGLRRAGLHGGSLTQAEMQDAVRACRSAYTIQEAFTAERAQTVTLAAAVAAHEVAWAVVTALGVIVDGERAAAVTAIDAAIVTSEALVAAWAEHTAILAKAALDADNALLDTAGALTGASTSAEFNTALDNIVTSKALSDTAVALVLAPTQAVATELPTAVGNLSYTNMDMA